MPKAIHRVTTIVDTIEDFPDGIRRLTLVDPDRWPLPPFTSGAHVDVHLPNGAVRQYSLCGDPAQRGLYRIAVQRDQDGRGGSRSVHADIFTGDTVLVSLPRNHFPLFDAGHSVMIAGGIGITPFLSMIPELCRQGRSFTLHHALRGPDQFSLTNMALETAGPGHVHQYFSRTAKPNRLDVASVLQHLPAGAHVYCCGPNALMDDVRAQAGDRLGARLHLESFGVTAEGGETAFEVELARSGRVVPIPAGQTILNVLRSAGVEIEASCEAGVCLECRTRVLEGTPVHKDLAMKPDDRRHFMTPCVSGCAGTRLVLDL